jgi:hypothetical protein
VPVQFPVVLWPLVELVQRHAYAQPDRAIEAARQLLKHCTQPEHLAFVYEQLGFAHLILGEHRLSSLFYEQAAKAQPPTIYVLTNWAHALFELGERERAVATGRAALALKDQEACAGSPNPVPLQAPFAGAQNLIAFSLYGALPRYCEMAVLNVMAARRHLPDFHCRFHVDASVPAPVRQRLQALGASCVDMPAADAAAVPGTFWRFAAIDDAGADCVLVRDVDALIDAKEAAWVRQWRDSGMPFHVMRDDCCHTELILAGMFGVRAGVVRDVRQQIAQFLQRSGTAGRERFADQVFLRTCIWPRVRHAVATHDSVYGWGQHVLPLPDVAPAGCDGPRNAFIGANHATSRLAFQLQPGQQGFAPGTWPSLVLRGANDALICRYPLQPEDGTAAQWMATLPQLYLAPIESGQWRYEVIFEAEESLSDGTGQGSVDPLLLGMGM